MRRSTRARIAAPHCDITLCRDRAAVDGAIAAFELAPLAHRFIDELSGGQWQRALVAMTFAQGTDYLLLDEPLNNLDLTHAGALMRRLREMAGRDGRTVVVVLHEINYAAAHADSIVAMKKGGIAWVAPTDEAIIAERIAAVFDAPVAVHQIEGRPFVLHHA